MRRASLHAFCALLALVSACKGCSRSVPAVGEGVPESAHRPNVLLITLDTTRADRLGCYGHALARTPRIDQLAREGVRVEHAIASAPITAPSHASMLSGLFPPTHGVRDNGTYRLPDEVETLPEVLHANGYATSAFISANVLHRRYNLSQGFDVYDDNLWAEDAPRMFMIRERRGDRTVAKAKEWFATWSRSARDKPFFSWVHLFDVHQPHTAPLGDVVLTHSPYDAEIASVDRYVGELIDALAAHGVLDDTIVIVTADHGESLGEHGEDTHAVFVYESTAHVPLVVRYPRALPRASVYRGSVRHVDLFPSVLSALGMQHPGFVQGVDLWRALSGHDNSPQLPQYTESIVSELGFGMAPLFSVRSGDWTYIRAPRPELYNRRTDPGEAHDLSANEAARVRELDGILASILSASEAHAFATVENPIDQETIESLRALGYVGDPGTRVAVAGMDPKDGIAIYEAMHHARALVRVHRCDQAIVESERVLEQTPNNVSALNLIAQCHATLGRYSDARAVYQRSLAAIPDQERVELQLAMIDVAEHKLDDAQRRMERAIAESPEFVEGIIALGALAIRRHDRATAERRYQEALRIDPTFPRALQSYADLYFREGDFRQALVYYERALAGAPEAFDAINQAGVTSRRLGDTAGALRYFERAQTVRPDSWIPAYNRACAFALSARPDDAVAALRLALDHHFADLELFDSDHDLDSLRARPDFIALRARVVANARHRESPS